MIRFLLILTIIMVTDFSFAADTSVQQQTIDSIRGRSSVIQDDVNRLNQMKLLIPKQADPLPPQQSTEPKIELKSLENIDIEDLKKLKFIIEELIRIKESK